MGEHKLKRVTHLLSVIIAVAIVWLSIDLHRKHKTTSTKPKLLMNVKAPLRDWKQIAIHHSASKNGSSAQFDKWHRKKGMENGLAYHFVIGNGSQTGDGEIEVGNRWILQLQGGHVKDDAINNISIGICLVGDFTSTEPSKKQMDALVKLVTEILNTQNLPLSSVVAHKDIGQTKCPGTLFPWQEFIFQVEQELYQ